MYYFYCLAGTVILSASYLNAADQHRQRQYPYTVEEDSRFIELLPIVLKQIIRRNKGDYKVYGQLFIGTLFSCTCRRELSNTKKQLCLRAIGKLIHRHNMLVDDHDMLHYVSPHTTTRITKEFDDLMQCGKRPSLHPYDREEENIYFNLITVRFPNTVQSTKYTISNDSYRTLTFAAYALERPLYKEILLPGAAFSHEVVQDAIEKIVQTINFETNEPTQRALVKDIAALFCTRFKRC